jgi:hypothetical protein
MNSTEATATEWLLQLGAELRKGLPSDAEVARRLGLAPQNWHNILAGRRTVTWDAAFAAAATAGRKVVVGSGDGHPSNRPGAVFVANGLIVW